MFAEFRHARADNTYKRFPIQTIIPLYVPIDLYHAQIKTQQLKSQLPYYSIRRQRVFLVYFG